ncbi:WecE Predicted pyridoxal phosphate-dependent enzyme apparently involved in regulation of cell wall biogenesis [Methylophilaceae bacterium]
MSDIHYARQNINQEDIDAVIKVLKSDFLTQGPSVPIFEELVSSYVGAKYAIAVNSATSALHISCLALGVGKGDYVWTTPITFVASANCAIYCGAEVDFVDIDSKTYNLSVEHLEEKLILAKKMGKLPKVVIPVHLAGQPCDMASIHALSQEYGFKIIEDASHAIGAKYKNEQVGNCRYSDITIFSFHPVKIITTGEGGMAITNNLMLGRKLRLFRSHGITSNNINNVVNDPLVHENFTSKPLEEIWAYQQIALGFNYRMTDIHAAIGATQMQRLNFFITKRHDLVRRYNEKFADFPLTLPWQHSDTYSAYHLYLIRLKLKEINKTQRQIYEAFHASRIFINLHYIPVYRQPYYENMGFKKGYCPNAEQYYSEALSLPLHPGINEPDQDKVIALMFELISK